MDQYWVEGLFANARGVSKAHTIGVYPASSIEPFARGIWANNPDEAIQLATEALKGGAWVEGPVVSRLTEEQRMRAMGAPEFPGLGSQSRKKRPRP